MRPPGSCVAGLGRAMLMPVGILYLAGLILGAGSIALQLLLASDGDSHADDTAIEHSTDGAHGFLPIFLSLRFWTFGLLAFGLTGSLLHYLELLDRALVPFLAIGMGLVYGYMTSWTLRALARTDTSSGAESKDAIGQVGRVLVPCSKERRGKIRLELRGQTLDLIATTDEQELAQGSLVLIEEVRGSSVHVSRAPELFLNEPSAAEHQLEARKPDSR
jgi:hypothetical protein